MHLFSSIVFGHIKSLSLNEGVGGWSGVVISDGETQST